MWRRALIFLIAAAAGFGLAVMSRGGWLGIREETKPAAVPAESARITGLGVVEGAGVRIRIEDATVQGEKNIPVERLIVHERDLLLLRNELFAAGAEAVSINGLRMVANSVIRCVGPAIRINDVNTAPPYVVDAVGDPDVLKQAVTMMGGVVDVLSTQNLKVYVAKKKRLTIPAYEETGRPVDHRAE